MLVIPTVIAFGWRGAFEDVPGSPDRCAPGVEGWAQYRYGEDSRGQSRELFMRAVTHVEISAFVIDPAAFVDDIEYHFERYVAALRDPKNADLRDNSTRTWERKHAGRPLHVPLGFPPGFGPSSSGPQA